MKAKLVFLVLLISCFPLYSQQKVNATLEKQEKMIQQLQTENQTLKENLADLEKDMDIYREDVRSTASNLHDDMSHWLVILSIIMTLIGGIVGVLFPVLINVRHDKLAAKKYDETLKTLQEQLDAASHQADVAVEQARKSDDALKETQDLKEQISQIKTEGDANVSKAEQAAKDALASQWIAEAKAEEDENPAMAIKYYSRVIDLSPDKAAMAYNNRGIAKGIMGDLNGALEDFNEAIRRDDSHPSAFYNRGLTFFKLEQWNDALNDINAAISLAPNHGESYELRGSIKRSLEDESGAFEDYTKAIELAPDNPIAYFHRSLIRKNNNDMMGAMGDINRAIELDPSKAGGFLRRGIFKESYSMDDAIDDYDKAIELDPNKAAYYRRRAKCYRKMAKKESNRIKAQELIEKAEQDEVKSEEMDNEKH